MMRQSRIIDRFYWTRKGGQEKGPVDLFPDAARRVQLSAPNTLKKEDLWKKNLWKRL